MEQAPKPAWREKRRDGNHRPCGVAGRDLVYLLDRLHGRTLKAAVLVLIFAGLSGPAWAQQIPVNAEEPLEVVPAIAAPGADVVVSGGGCAPGTQANLELSTPGATSTGSVLVGPGGQFSATVGVPKRVRPGRAEMAVSCQGFEGGQETFTATIVIERPALEVTGVNLLFGLGGFLITCGLGVAMRRAPSGPRRG